MLFFKNQIPEINFEKSLEFAPLFKKHNNKQKNSLIGLIEHTVLINCKKQKNPNITYMLYCYDEETNDRMI